jgi:hypothetical protein
MTWQRDEPASAELRDTHEMEVQAGSRITTKEAADALGTSSSKLRGMRQEMAHMDKIRNCTNQLDRAKLIKKAVLGQPC